MDSTDDVTSATEYTTSGMVTAIGTAADTVPSISETNSTTDIKDAPANAVLPTANVAAPTASAASSSRVYTSTQPCRVFTIPPDLPLTEDERSVLSKGLTFIPLHSNINEYRSRLDIEQFFYHLHLHTIFFNREPNPPSADPFSRLQHTPSTWTPPQGLLPSLDLFISNCRR
eukprot:g14741.t1